jgi:hypothetical protein
MHKSFTPCQSVEILINRPGSIRAGSWALGGRWGGGGGSGRRRGRHRPPVMVTWLVFWGFRGSAIQGLQGRRPQRRSLGWEEPTGGGRRCVGGRQGGGAPPAGVVVAGGRARFRDGGVTDQRG